ncbi:MAG: hypothetical protein AAB956_03345, partial [Patescibacteria group bacterium]
MIYVTRPTMPDINEFISYTKKIWRNRWLTNHGEFVNLLEKKLNIRFVFETRPELLNEKIIDMLSNAGCSCINFGIED